MASRSNHLRLEALERQMAQAEQAMDFELATKLRDEIAHLRGEMPEIPKVDDEGGFSTTVSQPPPGAMGLGTNVPVRQPPKGWVKPKKPDSLTTGKPRGR